MWFRIIAMILVPYVAVLPVLLLPSKKTEPRFVSVPSTAHPCKGTSHRFQLTRRPGTAGIPDATDAGRGWKRVESPSLILEGRTTPAELRNLAATIDAIRASLERSFSLGIPVPIRIRLHADLESYRREIKEPVDSRWDTQRDEIVLVRRETGQAVAHIVHWMVHRALRDRPAWLIEGLAQAVSGGALEGTTLHLERPVPDTSDALYLLKAKEISSIEDRRRAETLVLRLLLRRGPEAIRLLVLGKRLEDIPGWQESISGP